MELPPDACEVGLMVKKDSEGGGGTILTHWADSRAGWGHPLFVGVWYSQPGAPRGWRVGGSSPTWALAYLGNGPRGRVRVRGTSIQPALTRERCVRAPHSSW